MSKLIETDTWAVESKPEPKQFFDDCSWSLTRHFCMVDPEPEFWIPFIQPRFVG